MLAVFCAISLYPLAGMLLAALYPAGVQPSGFHLPPHFDLHHFSQAWDEGHFSVYFRTSLIVAVSVVAISTVLSVMAGYALGTMRFRGDTVIFSLFLLGIIIPEEAVIVPLYYDLRSAGLTDTYWSLILPEAAGSLAFGTFWMRAFFLSAPRSLIEAARIDGASNWVILWRVLVPLGRPAIVTLMLLSFLGSWNEFLLPLVMISQDSLLTLPAGLADFQGRYGTDVSLMSAGSIIVVAPVVVLYMFLQREFIRGMLAGAVKG
jgi:raffinose/stachyose/melibiose transport system permease protein